MSMTGLMNSYKYRIVFFLVKNSMKECNSSVDKKTLFVIKIKKNLSKNKLEFVFEK